MDNISLDDQLSRGRAYAISQGWTIEQTFVDGGESGKSTDRTKFQAMIGYIRENHIDVLLTLNLAPCGRTFTLNLNHL